MNKTHNKVEIAYLSRRSLVPAIIDSFKKLDPRHQIKNPVMFVVLVGSVLTTGLCVQALVGHGEAPAGFILAITFGCGLRLFSLILPKPWLKAAVKPKPRALRKCPERYPG